MNFSPETGDASVFDSPNLLAMLAATSPRGLREVTLMMGRESRSSSSDVDSVSEMQFVHTQPRPQKEAEKV